MNPSRHLVLVVDDDSDARELLSLTLQDLGFRVELGRDGGDALPMALALRPDAIVMDYMMAIIDGSEAARRLADDARTRSIPVLLLSGDPDLVVADARPHCSAFLSKPCEPAALGEALQRIVGAWPRF